MGQLDNKIVIVPCPRWPTITDVDLLEREIGKPVITSCQAYIWHTLRIARVKESVKGIGPLIASLANRLSHTRRSNAAIDRPEAAGRCDTTEGPRRLAC